MCRLISHLSGLGESLDIYLHPEIDVGIENWWVLMETLTYSLSRIFLIVLGKQATWAFVRYRVE